MEEQRYRVLENRVLRGIFEPMKGEVTEGWRELHIEGRHNLYSLPRYHYDDQIKGDEMGGTCSAHGEVRTQFWLENLEGRGHSDDVGVDGRTILKWILRT
jgi:hypothetical protein